MTDAEKKRWGLAALLLLATALVYLPALRAGFLWDDDDVLTANPLIHAASGWWQLWQPSPRVDYYPLTWTSFWLEWRLWGMNATGYHATNVLLHALGALLIWQILERLQVRGAWLAALVFAVHPVNVESVAWIAERKNTLSLVFYALTMLAFLRLERTGGWRWYWSAVGLFLLALLSKTSGILLPVVLLLCAWWQRGRIDRTDLRRSLPFFLLAAAFGLLTIWSQQWQGQALGGVTLGLPQGTAPAVIHQAAQRSLGFRLGAAGHVFWFYLLKIVAPVRLMTVYPLWQFDTGSPLFWLPTAAAGGLFAAAWHWRARGGKALLFGLLYSGLMLFPVVGVLNMPYIGRSPVVTVHLQYLAMIGIIGLVIASLVSLPRTVAIALGVAIVGTLGLLSWQRAVVHQNQETLWTDTLTKNPAAAQAHFMLGVVYDKRGWLEEAIARYTEALRLKPHDATTENNLANALVKRGRLADALPHFAEAVRLKPGFAEAQGNWASALAQHGQAAESLSHFNEALRLNPNAATIQYNCGVTFLGLGKTAEAIDHLAAAVRLDPANPEARVQLGLALTAQHRLDEAVAQFTHALERRPDHAAAHFGLGNARLAQGRFADAVAEYAAAVRCRPDYAEAHYNWGLALARHGQMDEAIARFTEAVRLNPTDAETQNNLGAALASQGKLAAAYPHFAEAVRLNPANADYRRNLDACRPNE